MRRRRFKRGDIITLQKSFKTDDTINGKVQAMKERPGYLTVIWSDGRETHVNQMSHLIIAVNGKSV